MVSHTFTNSTGEAKADLKLKPISLHSEFQAGPTKAKVKPCLKGGGGGGAAHIQNSIELSPELHICAVNSFVL